ncbi:MAG: acyltransferase [Verrucomicrobiaceae bacterium]|nr:MAG: acyltransferase [Verrucomicrobiaceae bacterium]
MKLGYIDSIRGIAILLVLFVHTANCTNTGWIPKSVTAYGQMGVQLFFIASAFTLCLSSDRSGCQEKKTIKYIIRRYFRIAPMYYFGIGLYFLVSLLQRSNKPTLGWLDENYNFINILSNLFLVHGFVPSANNSIVPGGWSIGTEFAFYLIFPFLYPILKKIMNGSLYRACLISVASLGVSLLADFIMIKSGHEGVQNGNFSYFNILNQIPIFITGIGYYETQHHFDCQKRSFAKPLFLALTALILVIWKMPEFQSKFVLLPWLSGVSYVFLMEIFKRSARMNPKMLRNIGEHSYSMYIFNFIFACIGTGHAHMKLISIMGYEWSFILMFLMASLLSWTCSLITVPLIEKNFINLGKKIIQKLSASKGIVKVTRLAQ